jgi:hypothetical protein
MISYIGMILIILGWGIQLIGKEKTVNKNFVLVYSLGVALLVADGFLGGLTILAALNLVSFLTAFAVYLKFRK